MLPLIVSWLALDGVVLKVSGAINCANSFWISSVT
jgi:hypothetical protein